jgi:hypothetical protein
MARDSNETATLATSLADLIETHRRNGEFDDFMVRRLEYGGPCKS